MRHTKKKPTSGPTIPHSERAKRGQRALQFSLDDETSDAIDSMAEHNEVTRSDVVRTAVHELEGRQDRVYFEKKARRIPKRKR